MAWPGTDLAGRRVGHTTGGGGAAATPRDSPGRWPWLAPASSGENLGQSVGPEESAVCTLAVSTQQVTPPDLFPACPVPSHLVTSLSASQRTFTLPAAPAPAPLPQSLLVLSRLSPTGCPCTPSPQAGPKALPRHQTPCPPTPWPWGGLRGWGRNEMEEAQQPHPCHTHPALTGTCRLT